MRLEYTPFWILLYNSIYNVFSGGSDHANHMDFYVSTYTSPQHRQLSLYGDNVTEVTGSLGIGIANPDNSLHVVGNLNVTGNIYINGCIVYNRTGTPATLGDCV